MLSDLLGHLIDWVHRLGHWGYLVVGVVVALECQAVLGLFMPAESLVLVAGFMAGQGVLQLDVLVAVVAVAAIVGDSVGYELGRKLGRGWLRRRGRWFGIRESHLRKVDDYFRRRGARSVFFSHFLHVLRPVLSLGG